MERLKSLLTAEEMALSYSFLLAYATLCLTICFVVKQFGGSAHFDNFSFLIVKWTTALGGTVADSLSPEEQGL